MFLKTMWDLFFVMISVTYNFDTIFLLDSPEAL